MKSRTPYKLFFDALGSETRLRILQVLRKAPHSVGGICKAAGLEQSCVSHNMCCLVTCGFVTVRREGKKRIYSLNGSTTEKLFELIDRHLQKYEDHFCECGVINKKGRVTRYE